MTTLTTPSTEYITIPVSNPSVTRGQKVKYGYKVYNKQLLNEGKCPLLLLSGWTGCMNDWIDLPQFISKQRAVIAVDYRGIGVSEIIFNEHITTHKKSKYAIKHKLNRPIPSFTYDDMVHDIYVLVQHLFNIYNGMTKIDILGWSMGGIIAQHFCLTFPQIVNNLILFGTTMSGKIAEQFRTKEFNEWVQNSTIGMAKAKNKMELLRVNIKFTFGYALKKEENGEELLNHLINEIILKSKRPFKTIIGQHNANEKYHKDNDGTDLKKLDEYIKLYGINTFIIHGDCDNVLPVGNAYLLNKYLSNSKIFVLKGEGHWIHATKSGLKQCIDIINNMSSNPTRLPSKL